MKLADAKNVLLQMARPEGFSQKSTLCSKGRQPGFHSGSHPAETFHPRYGVWMWLTDLVLWRTVLYLDDSTH